MHSKFIQNPDGSYTARVSKRGRDVLRDPLINKSSSFTASERVALSLEGLLPTGVSDMAMQMQSVSDALSRLDDPLVKYVELADLQDRNEVLFYRMLVEHLEGLMPIVYTPTVGDASLNYSHIFRRGRGRWITPEHRGRVAEVLGGILADIRLVVVTDNERILGLGDQGAGGMTIPVGKLALYTAAAGLHPALLLPVSLDVGTDNPHLLEDPAYLGWRGPRLHGPLYDELVAEFVGAVRTCFPNALLQWEDFKKGNAFRLLDRYREVIPSFNDDIQGTAAVALAGVMAACAAKGETLRHQRVAILGAGAAGVGIAHLLRDAVAREGATGTELERTVAVLDSGGLLLDSRQLDEYKREFAWPDDLARSLGFEDEVADLAKVVATYRPTVLIGTSGQPGQFTQGLIEVMAAACDRPAIFPFSNPTSKSEAVPADLLEWTGGRALIATGSPFEPVQRDGVTHHVSQGNNVYIFPGVGLGSLAVGAKRVTDGMFTAAATTLAGLVTDGELENGRLYPPLPELRRVSRTLAIAVAEAAIADGVAAEPEEGVEAAVDRWIWEPEYPHLEAV